MKWWLQIGLILLLSSACSRGPKPLVVGSKNFTEQIILAEILAQQIEWRTGLEVELRANLGGTLVCHRAMLAGQIDLYPEYTGTAFAVILKQQVVTDPRGVYDRVRAEYEQRFAVHVGDPFGFENTYAVLIRKQEAHRLKVRTLSDIVPHAPKLKIGIGHEFMERADGYLGLIKAYGLRFGAPPRTMDLNLIYRAIAGRKVDVIVGNSTESQIAALDLFQLTDDRQYFPPYEAIPLVREEVLRKHPEIRSALAELAGSISTEQIRRLNYLVDLERQRPRQVVEEFLDRLHQPSTLEGNSG